ncbi:hypothetical protein PHET_08487 [Paragonimus heterotremus]|uniref:Telomerase reverse transcriptase n=1 Tax=Paragonimus heterotremus TaxID=100268 RepID=A0A8J4T012_9TREM|nr:hypothetical protein PHET_08487 [Paragonimus heterotremus]
MLFCRRERVPGRNLSRFLLSSFKRSCHMHTTYMPLLLADYDVDGLIQLFCTVEHEKANQYYTNNSQGHRVPHREVYRTVCDRLKPFSSDVFGCSSNRNLFFRYLKHFIGMQFGTGISVDLICSKFKVPEGKESTWTVYAHGLVYGLLCGLVVFLLRQQFRWCEYKSTVPTVVYYTRADWTQIVQHYVHGLNGNTLTPVAPGHPRASHIPFESPGWMHSVDSSLSKFVHPSIARLVHKSDKHGFRMVVNANVCRASLNSSKKNSPSLLPISVNNRLRTSNGLEEFLSRLRLELPSVYRPSLFSVSSAFDALNAFREDALAAGGCTRFRLAKVDLLDCFHQIDHPQLLALFKQVCSRSEKFMFPPPNTKYLLREIDWFLKEAVVVLGGQSYRFIRGLPQGSCISPGLVNLYLAHADRSLSKKLSLWAPEKTKAASTTTTVVLRYLDDYLCIAPSNAALREVMRELQSTLETHGLTLNPQKVQSNLENFDISVSWLGLDVHNDLRLSFPDVPKPIFCRFHGRPLSAQDGIRRLARSRLHYAAWRYVFPTRNTSHVSWKPTGMHVDRWRLDDSTSRLHENARRLGCKFADIVWVAVKTSPERAQLLSFPWVRQLAAVVICRLTLVHRQGGCPLLRSTVAAFLHRLRAHRGELTRLFKAVRRHFRLKLIRMKLRTKSLS